MKEKIKRLWLLFGISMALVSACVWLYFLIPFFINPNSYQIIGESNRLISGVEILLQINVITVLIYFLVKKL